MKSSLVWENILSNLQEFDWSSETKRFFIENHEYDFEAMLGVQTRFGRKKCKGRKKPLLSFMIEEALNKKCNLLLHIGKTLLFPLFTKKLDVVKKLLLLLLDRHFPEWFYNEINDWQVVICYPMYLCTLWGLCAYTQSLKYQNSFNYIKVVFFMLWLLELEFKGVYLAWWSIFMIKIDL